MNLNVTAAHNNVGVSNTLTMLMSLTPLLISFSLMKPLDVATMNGTVACLPKARTVKPAEIAVASERLCKHACC
jgi:hypothetical protein